MNEKTLLSTVIITRTRQFLWFIHEMICGLPPKHRCSDTPCQYRFSFIIECYNDFFWYKKKILTLLSRVTKVSDDFVTHLPCKFIVKTVFQKIFDFKTNICPKIWFVFFSSVRHAVKILFLFYSHRQLCYHFHVIQLTDLFDQFSHQPLNLRKWHTSLTYF